MLSPCVSAGRLGTAPREYAKQSNRMSPAGIPMFYGAADVDTAITEVTVHSNPEHDHVTVGRFSLTRDISVIDFTKLPVVPSLFDSRLGSFRREIAFMHEFVKTLGSPVSTNDEAIEYVPTQVLTEFFLRVFRSTNGREISGIIYPSVARTNGLSFVLDIANDHCLDDVTHIGDDLSLVLDTDSVRTSRLPPH